MKSFLTSSLPLGGKVDKAKLWTNEGQPNIIQAFFSKSSFILNPHSRLPRRGSCRLLPTEEVFASLPLLPEKNSENFISSAKIVSHFVLSPFLHALPFKSIPALTLSSLLYPGFRRSGSSRPLQSPFFILPALFKNHFSSQSFRSESLFSPEAQLLSHNFPKNAVLRATFFYFKCEHLFVFL